MAIKVNLEDYIKIQVTTNAKQTFVNFNGDVKVSREMTLNKLIDVYSCQEKGGYLVTKKHRIEKVLIAPDSVAILGLISNKGEKLELNEVGLEKNEVQIQFCKNMLDEADDKRRKATTLLIQIANQSLK